MTVPQSQAEADIKIRDQQRIQSHNIYSGRPSRLSRRAYILMQLTIMLLIILGVIILYHFVH